MLADLGVVVDQLAGLAVNLLELVLVHEEVLSIFLKSRGVTNLGASWFWALPGFSLLGFFFPSVWISSI